MISSLIDFVSQRIKNVITWFKKASRIKQVVVIGVVVLVLFFAYRSLSQDTSEVSYRTEPVTTDTIVNIISETGEISITGKTDVLSTITGIVEEVYVENGDVVQRGQSLFKVTSTATEEERAKAYADYTKAKADFGTAEANEYSLQADMFEDWDEFKELAESDDYEDMSSDNRNLPEFHIPEKDWLASEAQYVNQEQVIAQAKASVSETWLAYQATIDGVVKSTANGTVANLAIASGRHVDSSSTALMVTSDESAWVELALNETDVVTVEAGQSAVVSVDALKGQEFSGTVERVDEVGTVESGVVTYNVYISLPEIDSSVNPGMTVQVDIETQKKENVLVAPNSAIEPYQGGRAVQVLDESTEELLYYPIEVGIVGPINSEVISGLKEGQEIVVSQTDNGSDDQSSGGGIFPGPGRN